MNNLGLQIQKFRKLRTMTQEKLAELAGLSPTFISGLENGSKLPSLKTLSAIADALSITPDLLLCTPTGNCDDALWRALFADSTPRERFILVRIAQAAKEAISAEE